MNVTESSGVTNFIDGLIRSHTRHEVEGSVVKFTVTPINGCLAFTEVWCGVETDELSSWPMVPPHWLHMSAGIKFPQTNAQPSPVADWFKHSRPPADWGRDRDHVAGYLSHCRSVLGEAL